MSFVAFTDNRDVRPPRDGNWELYTPPLSDSLDPGNSLHEPGAVPPTCDPTVSERSGMRNQNIYMARVTQGLFVGVPGNTKPLGTIQRAFVAFVENSTFELKTFRISILDQPPGGVASFSQFALLESIDVAVAPRSSVSRTFFVASSDARAVVDLQQPRAVRRLQRALRSLRGEGCAQDPRDRWPDR